MTAKSRPCQWEQPVMRPDDPERILRLVQRLRPAPASQERHDDQPAQQDCARSSQSK